MSSLPRALAVAIGVTALLTACASGRVRGGQGTEMGQTEEYAPEKKVEPPIGNVDRTSGPLEHPEPYPVLEIDVERRQPPAGPGPEPEPEPQAKPEPESANDPE